MSNTTTEVSEAAKALVEKLHLIHADPTFQSVWTLSHLHCGPYTGPQYADELAALEAALSTAPSGDGVLGMVLDPATIEACAAVADDHTPAKHEGTLAAHVTGRTISNAIRALSTASSTGKETP